MASHSRMFAGLVLLVLASGCSLEEVRSKNKLGVEWQHSGSDSTNAERYSEEPGFEFKWEKGVSTGVSYRRRDTNEGNGNNDNGLFVEFSFPIWKRKKAEAKTERIEELEQRLAQLENQLYERNAGNPLIPRDESKMSNIRQVAQMSGGTVPGGPKDNKGD